MLLNQNDVVLISHRRMFQQDEPRFFLGRVIACDGPLIKLGGYSFVKDATAGKIVRKDEERIKVLSLASCGYIVYQLPQGVDIQRVTITSGTEYGEAFLMDGTTEIMNLTERVHSGHF